MGIWAGYVEVQAGRTDRIDAPGPLLMALFVDSISFQN